MSRTKSAFGYANGKNKMEYRSLDVLHIRGLKAKLCELKI